MVGLVRALARELPNKEDAQLAQFLWDLLSNPQFTQLTERKLSTRQNTESRLRVMRKISLGRRSETPMARTHPASLVVVTLLLLLLLLLVRSYVRNSGHRFIFSFGKRY